MKINKDDPQLTEDQKAIQTMALDFANKNLVPNAAEWDKKHYFPLDVMRESAKLGFAAIYTNSKYGGCQLGRVEASLIFEALAYGDVATSAYISIHNMVSWMIDE